MIDDLILEYVYELRTKIRHLMNPKILNCPNYAYHGLRREELIKKLMTLNNEGYINFSINDDVIKSEFLNLSELVEMPFIDSWYVELTEKGGKRWEKLFKPIWEKYIFLEYRILNDKLYEITIESTSKTTIESILQKYQFSINSISDVREKIPWYPTYWKSLDKGFTVSFTVPINVMDDEWGLEKETSQIDWRIKPW